MRKRQQKQKNNHYCLFVNQSAANYNLSYIKKLTNAIRRGGGSYTIFEPDTPLKLLHTAQKVVGLRKWHRQIPRAFQQRGKVTALIACGGDGTVNLIGRVGIQSSLPVGILPMGKFNNIARSLYEDFSVEKLIKIILKGQYQKIDYGLVGQQIFIGSAALRFTVEMQKQLQQNNLSRFAFRWGQYSSKAVSELTPKQMIIKIDAFRFEVSPSILNINLLPYSIGLPFSEASIFDDSYAEIIFDYKTDKKNITQFIRQMYKKKYIYGSDVKLFRGQKITIQPTKGDVLYLDGELVDLPNEMLEIEIKNNKLKVFN